MFVAKLGNQPPSTPTIDGPTEGTAGEQYTYEVCSTDPEGDDIIYCFDFGDDSGEICIGPFTSGTCQTIDYTWAEEGTYQVKVQAKDIPGAISSWSDPLTVVISSGENQPPNKPGTPSGPSSGKPSKSYSYSASTTDPDGDQVYYWFDWDDGTNSGWVGPYNSGQTASVSHIWTAQGTYSIKVKAKDTNGAESVWSDPLSVSMPKTRQYINTPFLQFLENHPHLFPLLRQLLEL